MSSQPHVMLVPFPAQGHINPFTSLAHVLAASGVCVTLVHTTRTHSLLPPANAADDDHDQRQGPIRIAVMPDLSSSSSLSFDNLHASIPFLCNGLEELLEGLMHQGNAPCCLIADALILPWCRTVALKFGLPRIGVFTGCASVLALGLHIPELIARGYIPVIDQESEKKTIDFIPGLSPLCAADLPRSMKAASGLQSQAFLFFSSAYEHLKSANRILVNSMYELESNVVEALKMEGGIHADLVGPLFMMSSSTSTGNSHSSLLHEDSSCLSWLDEQREASVLYIAFGSLAAIEEDVFEELAHGLEASGESFLWVIRPDAHRDKVVTPEELLPEGFLERTKDRGLVISWAPQMAVLGHPSVGAFLTHCGWNSVLESLSYGIPMLGFPQDFEQRTNCKLIVHDWGVGLGLLETDACKIERMRVQWVVNAIMRGAEGTDARKRVLEWRDTARKAQYGTPKVNLQKLVDDLKKGILKLEV